MKAFHKRIFGLLVLLMLGFSYGQHVVPKGLNGDPISGGRIYDNWMRALDLKSPEFNQPLWAEQSSNPRIGDITWRCKECHGWDYKGAEGAFSSNSFRYTGFPSLSGVIGSSQEDVAAWLDGTNNSNHNFVEVTNYNAMNDVTAFLLTMQIDAALFIDYNSGLALGNEGNGHSIYLDNCAACHGDLGREINFSAGGKPLFIGDIAVVDPWRALHKIRFGTAKGNMPSAENNGLSLGEISDVLAYAQSLPRGNENYSISNELIDELGEEKQGQIEPIIWAVVVMISIVAMGLIWDLMGRRNKSS